MTVSTTIIKNSHNGNGSTTNFAYQFKILQDSDLTVIIRSSTGTETTKSLSTHYTVAGAGDASGGSITFTTGNTPASGETVVIRRNVPQTQAIDYIANDPFPAETHEEGLDRATMVAQQVSEEADRSIKLSRTNTMTSTEFTVGATDRANKILAFDSTGELAVTQELGTFKGNWGASTAYQVRDIVKDTSTNNIFICITAHTSSGSQPLTSNTDSAKWSLLVDAASATTSASAAATSATASANSATASASSASTASTQASNASTSASTASTQATNSANSATASASSATSAAASFDSFDDRYLGAKSSAPSTDNDGDALIDGALYWNSTSDQMFAWDGSAWVAIKPSSSEQTNINAVAADATDIGAVAGKATEIGRLGTSDAVADMAILGTSDVVTDMNTLGTADVVNDMNVLGTSANVTAMNTLGTSANVTAMSNCSGSIANINTTATNITDVNTFAVRYRIGSSNPTTSLDAGDLFFNTSDSTLKVYNGSAWVTIQADTDVKVSVSSNDTTPGFLNGKLVAGTGVSLTEGNDGGDETLTIASSGATAGFAVAMAIAL
ncbi:phage tail fiber protein [uncultured Mediterranean phage uvMED]|nr:phage tail fiber protein [uncultured Mediterranean phage uvMED]